MVVVVGVGDGFVEEIDVGEVDAGVDDGDVVVYGGDEVDLCMRSVRRRGYRV